MLCILKRTFLLIIVLLGINSCHTKPITSAEKSAKVKAKIEKRQKAERERKKKAAIEKHYERQAESTREMMKQNQAESDRWRKNSYPDKPFYYKVKDFFGSLKPESKPKNGIITKKQANSKKSNFIKRIFKKKKKKK